MGLIRSQRDLCRTSSDLVLFLSHSTSPLVVTFHPQQSPTYDVARWLRGEPDQLQPKGQH